MRSKFGLNYVFIKYYNNTSKMYLSIPGCPGTLVEKLGVVSGLKTNQRIIFHLSGSNEEHLFIDPFSRPTTISKDCYPILTKSNSFEIFNASFMKIGHFESI